MFNPLASRLNPHMSGGELEVQELMKAIAAVNNGLSDAALIRCTVDLLLSIEGDRESVEDFVSNAYRTLLAKHC